MNNKNWFALRFLADHLKDNNRNYIRGILKKIPQIDFFEACRSGEITSEEAAELLILRRESDYWIIRFFRKWIW